MVRFFIMIRCLFDFNSIQFSFLNSLRKSNKTLKKYSKKSKPLTPKQKMNLHEHLKKIENYGLIEPHLNEYSEDQILDIFGQVITEFPDVVRPNAGAFKVLRFLDSMRLSHKNFDFNILTFENEWWTQHATRHLESKL